MSRDFSYQQRSGTLLQINRQHGLDIVVSYIIHGVRYFTGFESIIDFDSDMHIEDALEAICPNSEWLGTIRITFEYIPFRDEEKEDGDID